MTLLKQSAVHPFGVGTSSTLNPGQYIINPLVHSLEQPINNVISETQTVVSGLGTAIGGITGLVPYFLAGWLTWTAAEMYFPQEMKALTKSWTRASKRMRIR
jgi:hypothetical protein